MISSLKFSSVLKVKDTIIIGFHDKRQTRAKEAAQTAFFLTDSSNIRQFPT